MLIADTFEVLAERKGFHLPEEIRVIGNRILERSVPLARLPHQDTASFLDNLRLNHPGVLAEIGDIALAAEEGPYSFTIAVRA